ncbi:MAG: ABC transporter ATP-binding protein [Propionibacteriaceae bacterium]|jgi:ABC-type multidrug transport system ATPase subunit|nr:ABC transporter ATP-binding protein [Propionibacteriaceae bacterium]
MLSLHNVTKNYGTFEALRNVTLDFTPGVYALLAPNGAGKTTLIKMLATLIFPTRGEILWNGDDIVALGAAYRDILGYLPQDFGYYKNHSPRQFLLYLAAIKAVGRETAKRRVGELLETVGLADVADKKMRAFSGGMVQRVGIAQALLNEPQLLILDEPTAGLDPKERVRFRNLISTLSKDRIVILSTHIVSDIETVANHVIMVQDRHIIANAAPAQIVSLLEGRVWETDDMAVAGKSGLVLTERQENGATITRFVSDSTAPQMVSAPGRRVWPVAPNLEDVFLHTYRDEA